MGRFHYELRTLLKKNLLSRRAAIVLEILLDEGTVTTAEIADRGYEHPPRAVRDLREAGVPVVTNMVSVDGQRMAEYSLGDPEKIQNHKHQGRRTLPKKLNTRLYQQQDKKCAVCSVEYAKRYFQIDHRIPYEIKGDTGLNIVDDHFMLLCASCQRKKSWSCENCENWSAGDEKTCLTCLWASPDDYEHVATRNERRVELVFTDEEEILFIDELQAEVKKADVPLSVYLKDVLNELD